MLVSPTAVGTAWHYSCIQCGINAVPDGVKEILDVLLNLVARDPKVNHFSLVIQNCKIVVEALSAWTYLVFRYCINSRIVRSLDVSLNQTLM